MRRIARRTSYAFGLKIRSGVGAVGKFVVRCRSLFGFVRRWWNKADRRGRSRGALAEHIGKPLEELGARVAQTLIG